MSHARLIWLIISIIALSLIALTPFESALSYLGWRYLHIMSAALFSGVVVVSASVEFVTLRSAELTLIRSYHSLVRALDQRLITASVSALLLSAIALMNLRGYSLWGIGAWPLWALSAFGLISLNGLFWIVIDVSNQTHLSALFDAADAREFERAEISSELRRALRRRVWVNFISVLTLPVLYALMVFKPL